MLGELFSLAGLWAWAPDCTADDGAIAQQFAAASLLLTQDVDPRIALGVWAFIHFHQGCSKSLLTSIREDIGNQYRRIMPAPSPAYHIMALGLIVDVSADTIDFSSQIDIDPTIQSVRPLFGIYRIEGQMLRLCTGERTRPSTFKSDPPEVVCNTYMRVNVNT